MTAEIKCPVCGSMMTLRVARRGPMSGTEFWGCTRFPQCKGSLNLDGSVPAPPSVRKRTQKAAKTASTINDTSPPTSGTASRRTSKLKRGDLLVSSANDLGPGKLVAKDGDRLVLEYFDTPGQDPSERLRASVPRESLRRLPLELETRVFWLANSRWKSGRVLQVSSFRDVEVRSRGSDEYVAEQRLHVRWNRPLRDPVGFATGGLLESPLLADLRRPFLRSILVQRAASRGMRGPLSSAIELHDHQLETAWRVLQDPVQRYLLADEVGLGKTIEAGMVIRQLLLDEPNLSVQFVLPPFLIGQWQQELRDKFFQSDFPHAQFRFSRNDKPATWRAADIMVVDEAHNLAALAESDHPDLLERHAKFSEVAWATPKLLLLSATPALNNEPVFLQMLKILDPAVYSAVTVEQLRERLAARAGLGRILLGLQPRLPPVLIRNRLNDLQSELADDSEIQSLVQRARTDLESDDRERLTTTIDDIRVHVAEIHRVHRRMLRTRRTSALEATYRVTGRKAPDVLPIKSRVLSEATELLELWRQEALGVTEGDESAFRTAAREFADAVCCALDPAHLVRWAQNRVPSSPGEKRAQETIVRELGFVNRRLAIARPLADALTYRFRGRERVVVFCPTADLANDLTKELRKLLPDDAVLEHRSNNSPAEISAAVQAFEQARRATVLVADSSAEEGRNFQFADLLVHVGLPPRANRLEQRIGRCDRWKSDGSPDAWESLLVEEATFSETFGDLWQRILSEGFGVFTSSMASLQFAVDSANDLAWQHMFKHGLTDSESIINSVKSALKIEVERIREQDALDSIETSGERGSIYRELQQVEAREAVFASITHALVAANQSPGNLRFQVVGDPRTDVGAYDPLSRRRGQQIQLPLVSVQRLKRDFLPLRNHRGTYLRSLAVSQMNTHLLRYGDPFIDAVSDFLWHDDRGRAFGMWRWLPEWGLGTQIAYRFDFAVQATPAIGDKPSSLKHRADGLFPPLIATVWIDASGRQIVDAERIAVLEAPYTKPIGTQPGGDFSLNRQRILAAFRLIPAAEWGDRWKSAATKARELAMQLPEITEAVSDGLRTADTDSAKRIRQLELRRERLAGHEKRALADQILHEAEAARELTKAISDPDLRLDATGIVIISGDELSPDPDS